MQVGGHMAGDFSRFVKRIAVLSFVITSFLALATILTLRPGIIIPDERVTYDEFVVSFFVILLYGTLIGVIGVLLGVGSGSGVRLLIRFIEPKAGSDADKIPVIISLVVSAFVGAEFGQFVVALFNG